MTRAPPYPVTHPGFWSRYWVTLRPYLFFVSGTAGWVGLALGDRVEGGWLGLAGLAFFLSYGLGQALTDLTQTDTDAISAPYRPLVRGEIASGAVLAVSLAGLLGCAAVFATLNPWTLVVSAISVIGLATYTPFKRRWWAGPPWNSWIVALLPLIGWLCHGGRPWDAFDEPPLLAAMGSAFGTYATFVLLGYLKDVEADRTTGYNTFPVRFGRRATVAASAGFLAPGLAASMLLVRKGSGTGLGVAMWAGGALALVVAHGWLLRARSDPEAGPGLVLVVFGFVLLHAGEAALLKPGWTLPLLGLSGLGLAALLMRPSREQV